MGVNLRNLVPKRSVSLKDLSGKTIAIDAYNTLYQFLAIIRQPDGSPLRDNEGKVTSHLSGLLYRTANLMEMGTKVAYVFDGAPPALKQNEIERRIQTKKDATVKYKKALAEGRLEEARTQAQATSHLKEYMEQDSKRLLSLMGIPWIQAPSEGEAQAAHMTKNRSTDMCASQDFDSLLFGAPTLIRNVTISGRRKLAKKPLYIDVSPEIIELDKVLATLDVTYEQLVDIGILVGTDYSPGGIKGVGPIKAWKLIREHDSLATLLRKSKEKIHFSVDPMQIRDIFLHPDVTNNYRLEWHNPDVEGVADFLCRERDFTEERVRKTLEKASKGMREERSRTTLDSFLS